MRYEDLATEPLKFAEQLLSFAGLRMSAKLRQHVWNVTNVGGPPCPDEYCTSTKDSRKLVTKWRRQLGFGSASAIDVSCEGVYRRMGYFPLPTNQSLLNLTVPAFAANASDVPGLWE